MIAYIGDISSADAEVLKHLAETYTNILEFGCGASTQVIAKYKRPETTFTSIDTSDDWIVKTIENFEILGIDPIETIDMYNYERFMTSPSRENKYDFIFNDGVDHLRRLFAIMIWPYLSPGGIIGFHDTRRAPDFRNVLEILAHFQDEIGRVEFNINNSNITLVEKVSPKPYDNWQITEKKEPWMLGYGEIPDFYKETMRKSE